MLSLKDAIELVREKAPDDLIRTYFEYKDEYRFFTSLKQNFSVENSPAGLTIVNKNTGEIRFEPAMKVYYDFLKAGEAGMKERQKYNEAEKKMQPVDLTEEQWKQVQAYL